MRTTPGSAELVPRPDPVPGPGVSLRFLSAGIGILPTLLLLLLLLLLLALATPASAEVVAGQPIREPWSLRPLTKPSVPALPDRSTSRQSVRPIDAFLRPSQRAAGVTPLKAADKPTWLRRVTLDLTGLPPSIEEQAAFLADTSESAHESVVDRLLASEQHGVRYGRHWLDVLRYTDHDENMPAAPGIHFWRDWVVNALNQDLPYDQFARAQITGNRAARRRIISAAGHLTPVEPRPEDLFALGFLARGAMSRANADHELAFAAVETISTAFLGMTTGCARCHDHFYDPISQAQYYSFKSLFDPLELRPVELATPDQVFEQGRKVDDYETRLDRLVRAMREYIRPHHDRLYEERLSSFPPDVQAAIRKPEELRTGAEQAIYDDYYPILRIDPVKIKEVMKPEEIPQYDLYLKQIADLKPPEALPVFWTVEENPKRASSTNYVLVTGDPKRPKTSQPVPPGFPFAPADLDFRQGRRETFGDWLTAPGNPLFARVAVNRIWAWHFGSGLHASVSDFGALGGEPVHPQLLDWLASEFVDHGFSMKWLHKEIVLSEAYRRASSGPPDSVAANAQSDPGNLTLWRFPLRRLEAEPVRDSLLAASGHLNLDLGGRSFDGMKSEPDSLRRAAYMSRGYKTHADMMPDFLQTFDAEDGRAVCTRRTQTVTAPQALFLMNSEFADQAAGWLGELLAAEAAGDLSRAVTLGFARSLGREPTPRERSVALGFLQGDASRLKGLAWMVFNLDEFLYIR
ncbi:MAG: DUF1549 and DUF1553 domain-containing protein [Limisphaerales bacterium]